MDQCTHEVHVEYWKGIIKACGQRPAGQSVKNWMDKNGICEQSDYHWQRKFRQRENSDAVPAVAEKAEFSFVEIPYCSSAKQRKTTSLTDAKDFCGWERFFASAATVSKPYMDGWLALCPTTAEADISCFVRSSLITSYLTGTP